MIELAKRIRTHGLLGISQSVLSVIEDYLFDAEYGFDTRTEVAVDDLDIDQEDKLQAEKYKPTRARYFRQLLRRIHIPRHGTFVDVGCGKGRVLMLAAEHGFDRVVGLEISANLCDLAQNNIERFRRRYHNAPPINVVCGNVLDYSFQDVETVFFLYSPFERDLTRQFLDKVRASLERNPRQLFIVINEFHFPELLENEPLLSHVFSFKYGAAAFDVYESQAVHSYNPPN